MLILHKIIFVNKKFVKKKLRPARRNFSLPFALSASSARYPIHTFFQRIVPPVTFPKRKYS